jgi:hypothetical protein
MRRGARWGAVHKSTSESGAAARNRHRHAIEQASRTNAPRNFDLCTGGVFVIDCDGFGRRHLGEVRIFKRCAAALKVLHPERQRKTFIVRAPRVFAVFWKIVRVFLDERIISKISILGVNDDLTPLVDEVGADYLPSLFGGGYDLKCSSLLTDPRLIEEGAFRKFEVSET